MTTVAGPADPEATLASMTLEQKVGQLFVPYVTGGAADTVSIENRDRFGVDTPAEAVARFHLGGVIYFAWSGNTDHPAQIAALSNGLQRANSAAGNPVPLSIAIDQETGPASRVGSPATVFPGAMALGAARDPQLSYDTYEIVGRELRAIGITTDYAPDADVNVNPANPVIGVRSFSADSALVAEHVAAAVRGLQDQGVSATAKHFPGHGDTSADSHSSLPVITHTRQQWERIDAPPFRAAIMAGVDAIMSAHIWFPALEPTGVPATLSHDVLTGLLRGELGFEGVIVTDSLRMEGVRTMFSDAEIAVRAVEAGADVLLDPPRPAVQIQAVVDAVRFGRLAETRIEASVRRILIMKSQRRVLSAPLAEESAVESVVGGRRHLARAQEIADRTTTLVVDNSHLVPLPRTTTFVTGWGTRQVAELAGGLAQRGWSVSSLVTGDAPAATVIADAVARSAAAEQIVITTSSAWRDAGQRQLVAALRATGKPVLVVALRDPYDLAGLPGIESYLATYSDTGVAVEAAVRVIAGINPAYGRLPVDITDPDDPDLVRYLCGAGVNGPLRTSSPEHVGLDGAALDRAWRTIEGFTRPQPNGHPLYPGAVLAYGHAGRVVLTRATGYSHRYSGVDSHGNGVELPAAELISTRPDTIYDLASVSKLFTAIVIMQQVEAGRVSLDAPVSSYLPEFTDHSAASRYEKSGVTVRQLLTHTSGFPAFLPLWRDHPDPASRLHAAVTADLTAEAGSRYLYSDLNLITLGRLATTVTGEPLEVLVRDGITEPLRMRDTGYNPSASLRDRVAATEFQVSPDRGMVWGAVHDENAWSFGGVAGHAGVFSTAHDLSILAQAMINGGSSDGQQILRPDTVQQMITNDTAQFPGNDHGLGFELDQLWYMGGLSSLRTAGHTGYTGTSLVIAFSTGSFVILLTNRVHPARSWGSVNEARVAAAQGLAEALGPS